METTITYNIGDRLTSLSKTQKGTIISIVERSSGTIGVVKTDSGKEVSVFFHHWGVPEGQEHTIPVRQSKYKDPFNFIFQDCYRETFSLTYVLPLLNAEQIDPMGADIDHLNPSEVIMDKIQYEIDYRELESKFGVHDWSTGSIGEYIGYTTYEVSTKKKFEKLIAIWVEILTGMGFQVGTVYTIKEKN